MLGFIGKNAFGYVTENQIADCLTTAHLWKLFRRRVPPVNAEYFAGAADDLQVLKGNVRAFQSEFFAPPGAIKLDRLDTGTTVFGQNLGRPYYFSAVGSLRSIWRKADAVASKVAGKFDTAFMLSTLSQTPMRAVAEASPGQKWLQLYLCGGKESSIQRIREAKRLGFTVLVLTIDTAVAGNRVEHALMKPMDAIQPMLFHRDKPGPWLKKTIARAKRRVTLSPQMITRLSWLTSHVLDGGVHPFVNIIVDGKPMPPADIGAQLAASAITWDDIRWIRDEWDGPLVIKGVHCLEDVRMAEKLGAVGVIFSNHGGRQMGRAISALQIVKEIMPHVQDSNLDFAMDGGVRSGLDVLIALSYGVKAVGIGRVMAGAVGAGGELGLTRGVEIMDSDLERNMRLLGVRDLAEIHEAGPKYRRRSEFLYGCDLPEFVF